jgi:pimeloyl-ACP methyl ester carboxylesterase
LSETSWFFLRGLSRESGHWCDFLSAFSQHFPLAGMVPMDLPGSGSYRSEESPTSIEACTDSLRARYLVNSGAQKKFLLAMSLGGMIALDWARRYPDDFAGIVIINCSLNGLSPWYHRLKPSALAALCVAVFSPGYKLGEKIILARVSNLRPLRQNVLDTWQTLARDRPISFRNSLRQLFAARRFRLTKAPHKNHLLLLASTNDRLVDCRCSERLAEFLGEPLVLHPTAGHDLALDDAPWVSSQVRNWLERKNGIKNQ